MKQEPRQGPAADYLRLSNISKSYASTRVVKDVSFSVPKGEVLTILGPSGCGKTTTLKIIAGFIEADGGSVTIEGQKVDHLSSYARGAGMVFQNYALFPHLTVAQNVAFGLRMKHMPKDQIARELGEILERVRLGDYRNRYPKELSGGQQQRVALARALVIKPRVLLLDEPFSSLDAKLRKQLRTEFREIHDNFGITSLFVTHDLEEAFTLSDKVAVMNGGVIEQLGSPSEIFARPQSRFVADFVGHKNIFEGQVTEAGAADATMKIGNVSIRVPRTAPGPAMVSVPIHRVRIARTPLTAANAFRCNVEHISYLGPFMQITVALDGLSLESHLPSSPEIEALRPGETVYAGWDASDVVLIPHKGATQ